MKLKSLMIGAMLLAGCVGHAPGQEPADDTAPPDAPGELQEAAGPDASGEEPTPAEPTEAPARRTGYLPFMRIYSICAFLLFMALPVVALVLLLVINGRVKRILDRLEAQSHPAGPYGPLDPQNRDAR